MSRPTVHAVWANVAALVARRSSCSRSAAGCVIVGADGRILSTGYNGPPARSSFQTNALEGCAAWCPRAWASERDPEFTDCPSVHAEVNALLYADRAERQGATAYVTRDPCWACALALAAGGITTVVWPPALPVNAARAARVRALLEECGVSAVVTSQL